jgi:hypothetical protein
VVKIATFAKPENVTSECKARNNKLAVEFQLKAAILGSRDFSGE